MSDIVYVPKKVLDSLDPNIRNFYLNNEDAFKYGYYEGVDLKSYKGADITKSTQKSWVKRLLDSDYIIKIDSPQKDKLSVDKIINEIETDPIKYNAYKTGSTGTSATISSGKKPYTHDIKLSDIYIFNKKNVSKEKDEFQRVKNRALFHLKSNNGTEYQKDLDELYSMYFSLMLESDKQEILSTEEFEKKYGETDVGLQNLFDDFVVEANKVQQEEQQKVEVNLGGFRPTKDVEEEKEISVDTLNENNVISETTDSSNVGTTVSPEVISGENLPSTPLPKPPILEISGESEEEKTGEFAIESTGGSEVETIRTEVETVPGSVGGTDVMTEVGTVPPMYEDDEGPAATTQAPMPAEGMTNTERVNSILYKWKPVNKEALGIFFGDPERPGKNWDPALVEFRAKSAEWTAPGALDSKKGYLLKQNRQIVDRYGPEIFVDKVTYNEKSKATDLLRENIELLQLYLTLKGVKKGGMSGAQQGTVEVKLKDLLAVRNSMANAGTNYPVTPATNPLAARTIEEDPLRGSTASANSLQQFMATNETKQAPQAGMFKNAGPKVISADILNAVPEPQKQLINPGNVPLQYLKYNVGYTGDGPRFLSKATTSALYKNQAVGNAMNKLAVTKRSTNPITNYSKSIGTVKEGFGNMQTLINPNQVKSSPIGPVTFNFKKGPLARPKLPPAEGPLARPKLPPAEGPLARPKLPPAEGPMSNNAKGGNKTAYQGLNGNKTIPTISTKAC